MPPMSNRDILTAAGIVAVLSAIVTEALFDDLLVGLLVGLAMVVIVSLVLYSMYSEASPLMDCPACRKRVSKQARECQHCGHPLK